MSLFRMAFVPAVLLTVAGSMLLTGCGDADAIGQAEAQPANASAAGSDADTPDSQALAQPKSPKPAAEPADADNPFTKLELPPPSNRETESSESINPDDAVHRGPWITDYRHALAQAKEHDKDILMDFTGSDWCTWCIRLNREVFSKDDFIKYAPAKFVLLELDFPRGKEQDPKIQKQNEELAAKFAVEGFPRIVLADSEGRPYAMTGYEAGGPEAYIPHLEGLRKTRIARDEAFASAAKATGTDRAKHLNEGLDALPAYVVLPAYEKVVEEIIRLDDQNEAGLKDKYELKLLESRFSQRVGELNRVAGDAESTDVILKEIAAVESEFPNYPDGLRELRYFRLQVLFGDKQISEFNKLLAAELAAEDQPDRFRLRLYVLKLSPLVQARKFAEADGVISEALQQLSKSKDSTVQLYLLRARLFADQNKMADAKLAIKDARKIADAEWLQQIDRFEEEVIGSAEESLPLIGPKRQSADDGADAKPTEKP